MRKPHADEYISYRYINISRGVPVALFLTSCFGICEILEPSKPKRSDNAFYVCTSHLSEPQKEAFSAWDGTKIVIMSESAKKNERKIGCMGQNNRKTPSFCFVNTLSVLPDYQYSLKIYAHANLCFMTSASGDHTGSSHWAEVFGCATCRVQLLVSFSRAREKMLKKSTESTAWRYSALKYSYMPCSRFL